MNIVFQDVDGVLNSNNKLVITSSKTGFTEENIKKAIKILRKG